MIDTRRPQPRVDLRDLAERHLLHRAVRALHRQRQRRQVRHVRARLRHEAHAHVARFADVVDPVADVDAGEGGTERLRDLTGHHAHRAGQRAIDLHFQFGLLAARGQADVDGAGHFLDERQHAIGDLLQLARIRPDELQLDLLHVAEAARRDRRGHAAEPRQLLAQLRDDHLLAAIARVLRRQAHVDRALVDLLGRAADRDVGVGHFRFRAREPRRFFRLQPRVLQVRSRRRFERDVELRIVRHREERAADDAERRQRERADERQHREADHREAVIERPADHLLVAVRLAIEPRVELVERRA